MSFDDNSFLRNPSCWPTSQMGRYCCLKRKRPRTADNNFPHEHGFMLEGDDGVVVNLGSIFDGGTGHTKRYDSIDALMADGWIVD